jgi:hypothetical protein
VSGQGEQRTSIGQDAAERERENLAFVKNTKNAYTPN